jgi:hypothetical protein
MPSPQIGSLEIKLFITCTGLYIKPFNNSANKFIFSMNFIVRNCLSYKGVDLIFEEGEEPHICLNLILRRLCLVSLSTKEMSGRYLGSHKRIGAPP